MGLSPLSLEGLLYETSIYNWMMTGGTPMT